jgi:hypothetical protein
MKRLVGTEDIISRADGLTKQNTLSRENMPISSEKNVKDETEIHSAVIRIVIHWRAEGQRTPDDET